MFGVADVKESVTTLSMCTSVMNEGHPVAKVWKGLEMPKMLVEAKTMGVPACIPRLW